MKCGHYSRTTLRSSRKLNIQKTVGVKWHTNLFHSYHFSPFCPIHPNWDSFRLYFPSRWIFGCNLMTIMNAHDHFIGIKIPRNIKSHTR